MTDDGPTLEGFLENYARLDEDARRRFHEAARNAIGDDDVARQWLDAVADCDTSQGPGWPTRLLHQLDHRDAGRLLTSRAPSEQA